jgi:outer membrane lipoprotein-sorting protein
MAIVAHSENIALNVILHFSNLLSQEFNLVSESETYFKYKLTIPIADVKELYLYTCKKDILITKLEYLDFTDNRVIIEFVKQSFNERLTRGIETFVIPNGTTIINN